VYELVFVYVDEGSHPKFDVASAIFTLPTNGENAAHAHVLKKKDRLAAV
jgi:hypothetical protein